MQDGIEYPLWRQTLADGEVTTVYAVRHLARSTRVRVAHFPTQDQPAPASRQVVTALTFEPRG